MATERKGEIIAAIANPGPDARRLVRELREQNGETETVLMPQRGQMLIGSPAFIAYLKRKTQARYSLTGTGRGTRLNVV